MKKQTTILYLSGDGCKVENFMKEREKEFDNIGVLLSYFLLRVGARSQERMNNILNKEGQGDG